MSQIAPRIPVHPRGCGERQEIYRCDKLKSGSSPRVRGTPRKPRKVELLTRFIPAGAGNARRRSLRGTRPAVHPRGCGERQARKTFTPPTNGSSPRVRGTLIWASLPDRRIRFIPAGAGNAHHWVIAYSTGPVHPRGCGERPCRRFRRRGKSGSSPRVRGTPVDVLCPVSPDRFIPAGAGNAFARPSYRTHVPVHPRGCGERSSDDSNTLLTIGSSPRVRGTPPSRNTAHLDSRFIPAGAGNAAISRFSTGAISVHPRGCGERGDFALFDRRDFGSSPRVRGTRLLQKQACIDARFIPAGAGNAPVFSRDALADAVHPRGCGERLSLAMWEANGPGSSPRVRGTPWPGARGASCCRFIPAGAGNALASST